MPQQGQKMGEPADGIGQPHDTQILVRNMRDFVAEHAGQLAEREATQQTVGQRDGRVMLRTGGEGVDDPAGHVVRYRHGRQPGPRRQFAQHSPKIGRFIRVQRACAIQPQGQPEAAAGSSSRVNPAAASASHRALSPNSRLPATAAIPSRVSTNSAVCRRLSQRCRAPQPARGADHDGSFGLSPAARSSRSRSSQ